MTDTPQTLVDAFVANTTGSAQRPKTVMLSNGNLLVAYSVDIGDGSAHHIRGQVFDPLGNPIGDEILFGFPHEINVEQFDIAALPGGQVAIATETTPFFADVMARRFRIDDDGNAEFAGNEFAEHINFTSEHYINPTITGLDQDSFRVFFVNDRDLGRIDLMFDGMDGGQQAVAGTQNSKFIARFQGGNEATLDSDTLSNGNMVVFLDPDGKGRQGELHFFIIRPDGSEVKERVVSGSAVDNSFDARVTALKGGGFVLSWAEDDGHDVDLFYQVFDNDGIQTKGRTQFADSDSRDSNDEPTIVALEDGGFIIFYDKNPGVDQIRGQRFDSNGQKVGNNFHVNTGEAGQLDATALPDGRVAIAFQPSGQGNIKVEILGVDGGVFRGSNDADSLEGGDGNDRFTAEGGDDTIAGEGGNDRIFGQFGNDKIDGGSGNDKIFGGRDNDQIDGGAGDDSIRGEHGNDSIDGSGGNDSLFGDDGNDTLDGGGGDDFLRGGNGADSIDGGDGNDMIGGQGGKDTIFGGTGNDSLFGDDGNDEIGGGGGHDSINGGAGDDSIGGGSGGDSIDGGEGNDVIEGNSGGDSLNGGLGNDTIFGDGSGDTIAGGGGDDKLFGGAGSDSFIFNDGDGDDEIGDFDALDDNEVIDLRGLSAITDFADLSENHLRQEDDDAVIDDGAGTTITLKGVNIADLDANDFIF